MSDDAPPSEPEFVVITASNPSQAAMYRQLVQARVDAGLYPARVAFRFYSDASPPSRLDSDKSFRRSKQTDTPRHPDT